VAKVLADILDIDGLAFKHMIEQWEARTGRAGHDLKLYSDMRIKATAAVKDLGLDPTDTISGELYFALQERARQDNQWLADTIGIKPEHSPEQMAKKIAAWSLKKIKHKKAWALRPALLRALLAKQPPKHVMKVLGLRSVDSMLKRNSPSEIVLLASALETGEWNKRLATKFKKIAPLDFDLEPITVSVASPSRVDKLHKNGFPARQLVFAHHETAAVMLFPPKYRFPLDVLAVTLLVLESISEVRSRSAFYRLLSTHKKFGEYLSMVTQDGVLATSLKLSDIGWNSIHRHLVGNEDFLAEVEQPHVTADDFQADWPLSVLVSLDNRFDYWKQLDYSVFAADGNQPVSLNVMDVVVNAANRHDHGVGARSYGKKRLWEELWARYLSSDTVAQDIVKTYQSIGEDTGRIKRGVKTS